MAPRKFCSICKKEFKKDETQYRTGYAKNKRYICGDCFKEK